MTALTDYLWFNTTKRQEFIRITDEVAALVKKSGVKEGMVLYAEFDGRRRKRVVVKVMGE
jgi:thiamine phosphate synthase YjbQ (UPF0047 family)